MRPFNIERPGTINQAVANKKDKAAFIAGGSSLVDLMKNHIAEPEALIDVTTILSSSIEEIPNGIRIGAMVRNSAAAANALVQTKFPLLSKAILAGASQQIRNMASTGGNLLQRNRCPYYGDKTFPCNKRNPGSGCSAIDGENRTHAIVGYSDQCVAVHPSDMCVALAALDATIIIMGQDQVPASIPVDEFFRVPANNPEKDTNLPAGAIITAVAINENPFHKNFAYLKLRDRDSYAFALVSIAAALHINNNVIVDARLASGGVAHKPWRWREAEKFLQGKTPNQQNFSEAAAIAIKGITPLSQNAYKVTMLRGAIETALQNCLTA